MKGWENNVVSFAEKHDAGTCPKCGSTDVNVQEHRNGSRYSITFHCMSCGSWDHFDGFAPVDDVEINGSRGKES
ncbi:MAG: hypothetical protein IJ179_05320 [Oscillospiraceae bacterium]|nr:hypothetical protein [Oscillospiraceae bacterium]